MKWHIIEDIVDKPGNFWDRIKKWPKCGLLTKIIDHQCHIYYILEKSHWWSYVMTSWWWLTAVSINPLGTGRFMPRYGQNAWFIITRFNYIYCMTKMSLVTLCQYLMVVTYCCVKSQKMNSVDSWSKHGQNVGWWPNYVITIAIYAIYYKKVTGHTLSISDGDEI
jgi:hypothetical protein